MVDHRVYCLLCDHPQTYLDIAEAITRKGRTPSRATKARVSRAIIDMRERGMLRCVGYKSNPAYRPDSPTRRWLQIWEVRRRCRRL